MTFRVGQRVVCVDDQFIATLTDGSKVPPVFLGAIFPNKGEIVTIRSISAEGGLRFSEYGNEHVATRNGIEISFAPWRFRPLQTISQADDVAMFRKLVETMKPTERLDALREMIDEA